VDIAAPTNSCNNLCLSNLDLYAELVAASHGNCRIYFAFFLPGGNCRVILLFFYLVEIAAFILPFF
jgi:hypothetical protein